MLTCSYQFLGVDDKYIVHDYSLTAAGLAPALPTIVARFQKHDAFRNNQRGLVNLVGAKSVLLRRLVHRLNFSLT